MKKIIILHNSEDRASRELVSNIPKDGNSYCIIEWYKNPEEIKSRTCPCHFGQPYDGPYPSAFPELVFQDDMPPDTMEVDSRGQSKLVKQQPGWARVRQATSFGDMVNRSKIDARKEYPVERIPVKEIATISGGAV